MSERTPAYQGHAVQLVFVGAGDLEALDQVVAQTLLAVDVLVDREERARVGELGGPGGAGLGDVRSRATGDGGHETVVRVCPLDLVDLDGGAGLLLEGFGDVVVEGRRVRVGALHDPDGELFALAVGGAGVTAAGAAGEGERGHGAERHGRKNALVHAGISSLKSPGEYRVFTGG